MKTTRMDTYQEVTDRIIRQLESGTIPWKHFSSHQLEEPMNMMSKKAYQGINRFLLSGLYASPYWLNYLQAQQLGGHVKQGAK
jgi:antirestriction protein ArdC